jgi:hypothetical protein
MSGSRERSRFGRGVELGDERFRIGHRICEFVSANVTEQVSIRDEGLSFLPLFPLSRDKKRHLYPEY